MNSTNLHLHLLIPGMHAVAGERVESHARIQSVLARSRYTDLPQRNYAATLCGLFGLEADTRDLPLGAITRYAYTGEADETFYLSADPVHLRADLRQVFLLPSRSLDVTAAQAAALIECFNTHFADRGWRLVATTQACWHLTLPEPEDIRTWPLREVEGNDIDPFLPGGPRALFWRGVLNEIQMLYHDAPPNRERQAAGQLPVNGLWLSGAGPLPFRVTASWSRVWSEDPLAAGLARLGDVETRPVPDDLEALLSDAVAGGHLVTLERLHTPAEPDDSGHREAAWRRLDRDWIAPLQAALRRGRVARCHIYDCAGHCFHLGRWDRWRLWRRHKPTPVRRTRRKSA